MNQYGQKFRVQTYVTKETFEKINAERQNESISGFVGSILELIYQDEGCENNVPA